MSELFNQNNENDAAANPVEALVGEGKKFASVEDMARGKLEADRYIEEQNAKIEALSKTNEKLDELYKKISESGGGTPQKENPEAGTNSAESVGGETKAPDTGDVEKLVEEMLERKERAQAAQSNMKTVRETLIGKYGDNAAAVVREKASELNMTTEEMDAVAASNPTAFFRLMGENTGSQSSSSMFNPTVNSDALNFNSDPKIEKGWSHFREMKKKNSAEFYSARVQNEINQLADKYGSDVFFKN